MLVSTHSLKNDLCHVCRVLLSTFRLTLHVKRASLDLGLKERVNVRRAEFLFWPMARLDLWRFHRNRCVSIGSDGLWTTFQPSWKYCFTLPVSSFDQTPLDSRFCPLEPSREYWTCVVFLGENQLARKCNQPNWIKSCGKTQKIQLVPSVLHFAAGGVRHEIRPIRMRY